MAKSLTHTHRFMMIDYVSPFISTNSQVSQCYSIEDNIVMQMSEIIPMDVVMDFLHKFGIITSEILVCSCINYTVTSGTWRHAGLYCHYVHISLYLSQHYTLIFEHNVSEIYLYNIICTLQVYRHTHLCYANTSLVMSDNDN